VKNEGVDWGGPIIFQWLKLGFMEGGGEKNGEVLSKLCWGNWGVFGLTEKGARGRATQKVLSEARMGWGKDCSLRGKEYSGCGGGGPRCGMRVRPKIPTGFLGMADEDRT